MIKIKLSICAAILMLNLFTSFYGQSAKTNQITNPTSTQVLTSNQVNILEQKLDVDQGKYKVVFLKEYENIFNNNTDDEKAEFKFSRDSVLKNFTKQLNENGENGYKVKFVSLIKLFAVVEKDEAKYEYRLFETESSVHFAKGIEGELEDISELGFSIVSHSQLSTLCDWIDSTNYGYGENCEYTDRFLVEKVIGSKFFRKQTLAHSFPGWGKKPSVELEDEIKEKVSEGFYPVDVFSKFEVLLEKANEIDENEKPDVKIIRSSIGQGNFEKKVNEFAKLGYRLEMTHHGIAVMYRNKETEQIPVSYVWLRNDKKTFAKELSKLQENDVIYKMPYPNQHGVENTLIFEQKIKDEGKRAEFKILKFEFDETENKIEKKVYTDLKPSSKESVKTMNKLVKEGFKIRGLFYSSDVFVILERRK